MSEEATPKATTQETAPSSKDEESSNKTFDIRNQELDQIENKELALTIAKGICQLTETVERQSQRIDELEKQLQENEVTLRKKNQKVLERYPEENKRKLIATAWNKGNEGVRRSKVEEIFNVGEDQARNIMKDAASEYNLFRYYYPGGPVSGKLYHRLSDVADELAEIMDIEEPEDPATSKRSKILENADWSGDIQDISLLDELKNLKDELEDEMSKKNREKKVKKKYGSLF